MTSLLFSRFLIGKEIRPVLQRDSNVIQVCGYAARKGTRERMRKKKVKVEVKKVGFIPHNLRDKSKSKGPFISKRLDDSFKGWPTDNVYVGKYFRWKEYDFPEAIKSHRESHHPQLYNVPNAPVRAVLELDMTGAKKNKFVDSFTRIAKIPHPFDHGENRSMVVFCKVPELKAVAENAGATLVGDADLIKKIERGDVVLPDFEFFLAHPNILPELVSLRGLLKKKFPNLKLGTLSPNLEDMVTKFRTGIQYSALRDEVEPDYGLIEATIGTLDMETEHLEKNFQALVDDILSVKPKRPGPFVTRALLKSPPSCERLKLNLENFIREEEDEEDSDSDDEAVRARA